MLWAADARGPRVRAGCCPGPLLGALALVRPEYLASPACSRWSSSPASAARRTGGRSLAQAAVLLAGVVVVVAPWTIRNAVALDRFVPISTGGGQVLFAGTYLPSDGDPEKVGAEVVARHPGAVRPADAPSGCGWSRSSPALAAQRYPGAGNRQGALADGQGTALGRHHRRAGSNTPASSPTKVGRIWSHGPRDVMREPVWEALHWVLVAFGLLGLAVLAWRRRWEALVLGDRLPRDHRAQRPAGRLAAAGAGDDAAGRGPRRRGAVWLGALVRPAKPAQEG